MPTKNRTIETDITAQPGTFLYSKLGLYLRLSKSISMRWYLRSNTIMIRSEYSAKTISSPIKYDSISILFQKMNL